MEESKIRVLLRQYYESKGFDYEDVVEAIEEGEIKIEKQEVIHTLPISRGSQRRDIYFLLVNELILTRSEYFNSEKQCWDHWSVLCP